MSGKELRAIAEQLYVNVLNSHIVSYSYAQLINAEKTLPRELEAQTPGAFVVLLRENEERNRLEVLLVQRKDYDGLWNLPGGGVDEEETFAQGAIREVREETGLEVKLVEGTARLYHAGPLNEESEIGGERRYDRYVGVIGVIVGGELQLSEESAAIQWFPVKDLPEHLYGKHKLLIHEYFTRFNFYAMMKEIFFAAQNNSFIPEGIEE